MGIFARFRYARRSLAHQTIERMASKILAKHTHGVKAFIRRRSPLSPVSPVSPVELPARGVKDLRRLARSSDAHDGERLEDEDNEMIAKPVVLGQRVPAFTRELARLVHNTCEKS
jgi:hypothetical protein